MGVLSEFAKTMQWRTRLAALALAVGLCCGPVCTIYTLVMEFLIDKVWKEIPEMLFEEGVFAKFPNWAYIIFVCTFLGALSGLAIRQFGPPLLNLPGTVKEIYETGCIDHEDAPRMFVISLVNILGAGSLGPEAPLVAIGGMSVERAPGAFDHGADIVSVVTDITLNTDPETRTRDWIAVTRGRGADRGNSAQS